jgi:hypothetical protein
VPGSDIKLILAVIRPLWAPRGTNHREQTDIIFDVIIERLLTEAGSPCRRLPWPVPGLEVPRPVRPIDSAAPVWTLERWDSWLLIFGESAASDADDRGAGQMLALAVRAVLTFQHRAVRGPGPWTTFPQEPGVTAIDRK